MNLTSNKIDLSHWNLFVAEFSLKVDTGMHTLDVSMNSTAPDMASYDRLMSDMTLLNKILTLKETDPGVRDAWEKLMTVMALSGHSINE